MILRNENQNYEPGCGQKISAFEAIASVQKNDLLPCWFVTQPDHAHLSGAIAAGFDRRRFPELTADVVEAIGLHDEGWEIFDGSAPEPRPQAFQNGHAIPFIAIPPDQFLRAWETLHRQGRAGQRARGPCCLQAFPGAWPIRSGKVRSATGRVFQGAAISFR